VGFLNKHNLNFSRLKRMSSKKFISYGKENLTEDICNRMLGGQQAKPYDDGKSQNLLTESIDFNLEAFDDAPVTAKFTQLP
jgi:hypothetical protein